MIAIRSLLVPVAAALLAAACDSDENSIFDPPIDTSLHTHDADDANIQYTGRIDFTNAKLPRFALGATSITARFKGVGVSVTLKDEHRYGKWRNYYDAVVDGVAVSKIRINDDVAMTTYEIASNLPPSTHEVTIVKRTEPNAGVGYFGGFTFQGTIAPPPARPAHKLLIFGDSITAGSGTEVPRDGDPGCSADEWGSRSRTRTSATARSRRGCSTPSTTSSGSPASAWCAITTATRRWATRASCRRSTTSCSPSPTRAPARRPGTRPSISRTQSWSRLGRTTSRRDP